MKLPQALTHAYNFFKIKKYHRIRTMGIELCHLNSKHNFVTLTQANHKETKTLNKGQLRLVVVELPK
jgi:hypothetical protein